MEAFAHHLTADAKILDENEETGIKKFRYVRVGEDHYSLAFTYAWMSAPEPGLVSDRKFWTGARQGKWPVW